MECYAGLGVSLELTSVRVMDRDGKVVREAKVATDPSELSRYLHGAGVELKRAGMEAGATMQRLYDARNPLRRETFPLSAHPIPAKAGSFNPNLNNPRTSHE